MIERDESICKEVTTRNYMGGIIPTTIKSKPLGFKTIPKVCWLTSMKMKQSTFCSERLESGWKRHMMTSEASDIAKQLTFSSKNMME